MTDYDFLVTERRYAIAVYVVVVCLFVRLSVHYNRNDKTNRAGFRMEAPIRLSYNVL